MLYKSMPRPKKSPETKRGGALTMWANEAEVVEVHRAALEAGMTISDYIRAKVFAGTQLVPLGPVPTKDGYVIG